MEYSLEQKKECGPTNSFDLSSTDLQDNKLKLQETANTQKIMMSFTENNMRWCRLAQDIQIQNFHLRSHCSKDSLKSGAA